MEEKLLFQYIMNYKAYRRIMITVRILITLAVAGGLCGLFAISIPLGIILPVMVLFIGAIWIIVSLSKDITYMFFDTRFVIKHRDKRVSVPLDGVKSVKYRRAFYEKDLATGTLTVAAKDEKSGKIKKYKIKHVFDAQPLIGYFKDAINSNSSGSEN